MLGDSVSDSKEFPNRHKTEDQLRASSMPSIPLLHSPIPRLMSLILDWLPNNILTFLESELGRGSIKMISSDPGEGD